MNPSTAPAVAAGRPRRDAARSWLVLSACLLAPVVAALLRKFAPGQPAFLEIGGITAVLIAGAWLLTSRRSLPGWAAGPLLLWAYFQLVYAAFAMTVDWRVGAAATLTRIAPMLMAPIAYAAVRSAGEFHAASRSVAWIGPILLPVGLALLVLGTEGLPIWLQPIQSIQEIGKGVRAGVPALAAVFSSQWVLSMSMLAVFYICVANATLAEEARASSSRWWVLAAAAFVLIYLSTRRGAMIAAGIGLVAYAVDRKRIPTALIGVLLGLGLAGLVFSQLGVLAATRGLSRTELVLDAFRFWQLPFRVGHIFGRLLLLWLLEAPFGTFLGFAGPEGEALVGQGLFSRFSSAVVEVGGAQLAVEMGILGALLMPLVIGILVLRARRLAKGMRCRRAVNMLVLFQVLFFGLYYTKEMSAMTGVSMAQLFFWAIPGICAAMIERERRIRRVARAWWLHETMRMREKQEHG